MATCVHSPHPCSSALPPNRSTASKKKKKMPALYHLLCILSYDNACCTLSNKVVMSNTVSSSPPPRIVKTQLNYSQTAQNVHLWRLCNENADKCILLVSASGSSVHNVCPRASNLPQADSNIDPPQTVGNGRIEQRQETACSLNQLACSMILHK